MTEPYYFQWQNEVLRQTIYPMREVKLRDFLTYYMEADLWAQYKDKDVSALEADVQAHKKRWEAKAAAAYKEYLTYRDYFLKPDVRAELAEKFQPLDEAELTEINNKHALFIQSWPKDVRGEKSFVESVISGWKIHRDGLRERIKSLARRHENMDPNHPKYAKESKQLQALQQITLPMAQFEMERLLAFRATYDRVEERKLAWRKLSQSDPNFKTPEAEFVVQFPQEKPLTVRDIVYGKIEAYVEALAEKDQYALLEEIYRRFQKEPRRFPLWLQYMVVHFSGMRYASAHGSWADPKDLLIRLKALETERALIALDDAEVEKRCQRKLEQYGGNGSPDAPKLARATEPEWKGKAALHLNGVKASGPKTKRAGLVALSLEEVRYEMQTLTTDEALTRLEAMKDSFPQWAWKEIVRFTPLRINHARDLNWETLTKEEEAARNAPESAELRALMDAWENHDPSAWRDEHGRTCELIVARAVCNETAEHCQHLRGHLPPGGLAPKPKWYLAHEAEQKLPGAYYVKPTSEKDYKQGASILWLRFVDKEPSVWQIAKSPATKQGVGLLPPEFLKKKSAKEGGWEYKVGEITTRSRVIVNPDKTKTTRFQWLRWIHEATAAEVAETADGMVVITFETALPDGDKATSAVGTFKMPLQWHLDDGSEDEYNRSFVGYVPEGEVPLERVQPMLDWNKILRKKVV